MTDIDKAIGRQLRALRLARSMSLSQVGGHLGVSCQQVQKYEAGLNRLGAARLYELAVLFDVPADTFFEKLALQDAGGGGSKRMTMTAADVEAERQAMQEQFRKAKSMPARRVVCNTMLQLCHFLDFQVPCTLTRCCRGHHRYFGIYPT